MHPLSLSGGAAVTAGILLGFVLGFIMVRSGIVWRKTFSDFFMFKDGNLGAVVLFSISIGAFLFFLLKTTGAVNCHVRPSSFWASLTGGMLFASGLFICRQIPVTAFALFGTGRLYALWIIAGMLLAIPAVKLFSGFLSDTIYALSPPFHYQTTIDAYMPPALAAGMISFISLILAALFHFALSSGGESSGKGAKPKGKKSK